MEPLHSFLQRADLAGLGLLLLAGLAVAVLAAAWHSAWMLTHPPRRTYASAVARSRPGDPSELAPPRPFESWTFRSGGLTFHVWDIAGDRPSGPVVVLSHGWADSRLGGLLRLPALAPHASRLILWDLRGHGEAPGACTLGTCEVDDLAALLNTLADTANIAAPPVVLYGWSLGAGISIAAAARPALAPQIRAVVAEAPYRQPWTPARRVMRIRGMPYRLNLPIAFAALGTRYGIGPAWRGFDRALHAARLSRPLLVLHGEHDAVSPLIDGQAIAADAASGVLALIPGGGHNDLWTDQALAARCAAAVGEFLEDLTNEAKRTHRKPEEDQPDVAK